MVVFNSFYISILTSLISTFLGIFISFFIFKYNIPLRKLFFILIFIGISVPNYLITSALILFLSHLKIGKELVYSINSVIITNTISYTPLSTLIIGIGLININPRLEKQINIFFSPQTKLIIYLKEIKYYLIFSIIFIFYITLSDISVVDIIGINTLSRKIYIYLSLFCNLNFSKFYFNFIILITITFILVFFIILFLNKTNFSLFPTNFKEIYFIDIKKMINKIICIIILFICMFHIWCIIYLFYNLTNYNYLINTSFSLISDIKYTLFISFISSISITFLGFFINFYFFYRNKKFFFIKSVIYNILLFIGLMPHFLIGIFLLKIYNFFPLIRDNIIGTIIGLIITYIPYAILIFIITFKNIPNKLINILATIEASKFKKFLLIASLLKKEIILCFFIVFTFCTQELDIYLFLTPPGIYTLSSRTFSLLHYGIREDILALEIINIFLIIIIILSLKLFNIVIKN